LDNVFDEAQHAQMLYESGRFSEALSYLDRLVSGSGSSLEKASYLLDEAICYRELQDFRKARLSIDRARELSRSDALSCARADFIAASILIAEGQREQALTLLDNLLDRYESLFQVEEGRQLYEEIQVQRGFTLMHLCRYTMARLILEETAKFDIDKLTKSELLCHLGRCYNELSEYVLAKETFIAALNLGVTEEWEATFHYYYGYTLFKLKEFDGAQREFILAVQSGASGVQLTYCYKMLANVSLKLHDYRQARLYRERADKV
jgi:tetratricopeptide (TPR) repeat protein